MTRLESPTKPRLAINNIAEMAADAIPTLATGISRAASTQYRKPKPEVTIVDPNSQIAFRKTGRWLAPCTDEIHPVTRYLTDDLFGSVAPIHARATGMSLQAVRAPRGR
jgi:hypothetical protein